MLTFCRSPYQPKILEEGDVASFLVSKVEMFYEYMGTDR